MHEPIRTVIVCGGRAFADAKAVAAYLGRLTKPFRVVTGGAKGADALAEAWARENHVPCVAVPADWATHGRAAGPLRNQKMLVDHQPVAVIAFPGGRGTEDMIRRASAAGVRVFRPIPF